MTAEFRVDDDSQDYNLKPNNLNTYSFRIMTQSGVAKFDFFEIFYTQGLNCTI